MTAVRGFSVPSLRPVQQRCCEFWLGARREEGEYPLWSLTDEQQSTRPKSAQAFGLGRRPRLTASLPRYIGVSHSPRQARPLSGLPTLPYAPQTWCSALL